MMSLGDPGCCRVKSWFVCNSNVLRRANFTSWCGSALHGSFKIGMTIVQPKAAGVDELKETDWREELDDLRTVWSRDNLVMVMG